MQAAGATAGTIAMSATYPLDMVRGRLTVQLERTGHYTGIVNAAQSIVRQVGHAPLALLTTAIAAGISILASGSQLQSMSNLTCVSQGSLARCLARPVHVQR